MIENVKVAIVIKFRPGISEYAIVQVLKEHIPIIVYYGSGLYLMNSVAIGDVLNGNVAIIGEVRIISHLHATMRARVGNGGSAVVDKGAVLNVSPHQGTIRSRKDAIVNQYCAIPIDVETPVMISTGNCHACICLNGQSAAESKVQSLNGNIRTGRNNYRSTCNGNKITGAGNGVGIPVISMGPIIGACAAVPGMNSLGFQ